MREDYVRREDVLRLLGIYRCSGLSCRDCTQRDTCAAFNIRKKLKLMSVTVKPVVTAKWVKVPAHEPKTVCSGCECIGEENMNFCPWCGAEMENGGENE